MARKQGTVTKENETDDQAYLDQLFDQMVERIEDGRAVDDVSPDPAHEHLRDQVAEMVRLAYSVAAGRPPPLPTIPGYRILGELGRGGMGSVYLAQQEKLGGRSVALKVLPSGVAQSPQARARFRSEALAVARLQHPHIVAVHDIVEDQGVCAYAMEWIDGPSLAAVIDALRGLSHEPTVADFAASIEATEALRERSIWSVLAHIGLDVAEALAAVHGAGLLHRDVKPSNVLVRHDGVALLSDFGLARASDSAGMTQTGVFVGTTAYAAPEQLRGERAALDERTDVYGLGATLYHALGGRAPVGNVSPTQMLRHIEEGQIKPLRKVCPRAPAELATIVGKAMAPEPERRYATAAALASDLRAWLAGEPISARPPSLVYVLGKRLRRHRLSVLLATVLAALALVAAGQAVWERLATQRARFEPQAHGEHVTCVDIAVLGDNVPTSLPADKILWVNELRGPRGPSGAMTFGGGLGIGFAAGQREGALRLEAGQKLNVLGELQVGCNAAGTLRLQDGAVAACARAVVAAEAGSWGRVRVGGGGSRWHVGGTLVVGARGPGTMEIGPAAALSAAEIRLGLSGYGEGIIAGPKATVAARRITVGQTHDAYWEMRGGATAASDHGDLGRDRSGTGRAVLRGDETSWRVDNDLLVGSRGAGFLQLREGAEVSAHNLIVAHHDTASGELNVSGVATRIACSRTLQVGRSGQAKLDVSSGHLDTDNTYLGFHDGSKGEGTLRGPNTVLDVAECLAICGRDATGALAILDGARVTTVWGEMAVRRGGAGRLTIHGAGSRCTCRVALHAGARPFSDGGVAEISIDDGGTLLVLGDLLLGPRSVLQLAAGTVAVSRLTLREGSTTMFMGGTAALRQVQGDLVLAGGTLCTACAPETLDIDGDLQISAGALRLQVAGAAAGAFDRVRVTGAAALGGTLEVELVGGFAPRVDERLVILRAAEVSGRFDGGGPRLPLRGGGSCEVVYGADTVTLTRFAGPFGSHPTDDPTTDCLVPRYALPAVGPFAARLRENTAGAPDHVFLGPPDGICHGLGTSVLEYDLAPQRLRDGPGPDLSVYEGVGGGAEFERLNVQVSADGIDYVSILGSQAPLVRIEGDDVCTVHFGRSYDLAGSGLRSVRYVRLLGRNSDTGDRQSGFDIDAVGLIHYTSPDTAADDSRALDGREAGPP